MTFGPHVSIVGAFVSYIARHVEVEALSGLHMSSYCTWNVPGYVSPIPGWLNIVWQYESPSTVLDLAWHWVIVHRGIDQCLLCCIYTFLTTSFVYKKKWWHISLAVTGTWFLQSDCLSNCLLPCSMSPEFNSEIGTVSCIVQLQSSKLSLFDSHAVSLSSDTCST
jgi:hypothetical protein